MGLTVYAEGMGLFHKGSGGKSIAPADVCLSPPPPPAGPVPVPYVNNLMASDLSKGSKTVKIDGEETALEDQSEVATSMGDEPGTQGGGVVTHKTKGKGFFELWSFTVKIEGKGVCRHGDMMGQNCASTPPDCISAAAITAFKLLPGVDTTTPCPPDSYQPPKGPGHTPCTEDQQNACRGGPCWQCTRATSGYGQRKSKLKKFKGYRPGERFTPDHQPPQKAAWYMGGCHMKPSPEAFKEWAKKQSSVIKHCKTCSMNQGTFMSQASVADIRSWM